MTPIRLMFYDMMRKYIILFIEPAVLLPKHTTSLVKLEQKT